MVIILMGVTGSGKSTVGEALSMTLNWPFYDGDDYHPQANVDKMAQGIPLTDEDRLPWLRILAGEIGGWLEKGEAAILASSALKQRYRDILVDGREAVRIVHLRGSKELISGRLAERKHRYMPASLLDSQFEALEAPADALEVDIGATPEEIAAEIKLRLDL
jgi:gluconokinase